ncbi:MAG: sulfatase-like hydrolase/transferase [Kiritimatiellaeota bacterium]|nr:sulfatase-like hydrolase/transferase [Kiritimatiellota bacterium]
MNRMLTATVALAALALATPLHAAPPTKPNIIFILADDLGIDGVSCYGADKRQTPQIDKLAASGTRFETCYAAPLCGPSRCLLMTGRYAFRTGGLQNGSWGPGGTGAKSVNEQPMAKLLKQAGYVTGESGKWRQVGETPREWGFDEYCTDPTAGGWYWKDTYIKNGETVNLGKDAYNPDIIQAFSLDFIRRHKDQTFFLYYAMHLVHKPTLHTPDSKQAKDGPERYDDNIAYMDKQVGEIVAELEKLGLREKTLVIFSGDNGTATGYPAPIGGRLVNGHKGTMLEGGSRVPFIASWPGVTPAGKVSKDIVSFADPHATFVELAGAKLPDGLKFDGQSIAPQLRGEQGTPRAWAYVQLGARWFVREPGWKLNESGELFNMSDAPFVEKPVAADTKDEAAIAARTRLQTVLDELKPGAGQTGGGEGKKGKAGKKKRKNK